MTRVMPTTTSVARRVLSLVEVHGDEGDAIFCHDGEGGKSQVLSVTI